MMHDGNEKHYLINLLEPVSTINHRIFDEKYIILIEEMATVTSEIHM